MMTRRRRRRNMRTIENHNEGGKEAEEEFNAKKIKTIERSFMETLLLTST